MSLRPREDQLPGPELGLVAESLGLTLGHELGFVDLRASTPLKAGQVDDTPYGGGAGMVIRVDVVEAALRERYGEAPPPHRTIPALPASTPPLAPFQQWLVT